jgi:hypothetical protein
MRILCTILLTLIFGLTTATSDTTTVDTSKTAMTDSAYFAYKLDSMKIASETALRLNREGSQNPRPDEFVPFVALLIPIGTIIAIAVIMYRRIEARKTERMAMIERGVDPSLFMVNEQEGTRKYSALRTGMMFAGIGLGLFTGAIVSQNVEEHLIPLVIIAPSILFAGVGLIGYHLIAKKIEKSS